MRVGLFLLLGGMFLAQTPRVEDLIRQLGDDDFEVREKAARLLEEQGEKARPGLVKAARESGDAEIRKRADDLLQTLDRQAAIRALAARFASLKQQKTPPFDATRLRPLVEKKGVLTEKETWGPDRSYLLTANTTLTRGAELTILPGTVVLLADGVDFRIQAGARFTAEGEAEKPILLTSQAEAAGRPGHWGKWNLQGNSLTVKHIQVRRSSGVRMEAPGADLSDLGIYETQGDALTVLGPVRRLDEVTVRDATGTGLLLEGNSPTLGSVVVSQTQIGVLLRGGAYPTLREVSVVECKAAGIYVTGGSYPRIDNAIVLEAETGLRVQDGAYPRLTNLLVGEVRADGVLIEGASYPSLGKIEVNGAGGVGLRVTGSSYPYLGTFQSKDCKKGEQQIEPGSRVQPLKLERLRGG